MKSNKLTIAVMFGMVFMVGFVTMFTGPLAAVVKAQFGASNALSQFGSSANFMAYLFMGIPCGMVLKRKGYRFTSLAAVSVGILGVALQIVAGFVAVAPSNVIDVTSSVAPGPCAPGVVNSTVSE